MYRGRLLHLGELAGALGPGRRPNLGPALARGPRRPASSVPSEQRASQVAGPSTWQPAPDNEPVIDYGRAENGSQRAQLEAALAELAGRTTEIPIVINGQPQRGQHLRHQLVPFEHRSRPPLAEFHHASSEQIDAAARAALEARPQWEQVPLADKCALMERAAELVAGKYRHRLNAATILGQAKTFRQAEIDSACELADFLRFNAHYARQLEHLSQPKSNPAAHETNSVEFRPLDGFVAAISPFNFTAIGGNLASAPALMGNCVVWKPSDSSVLANYLTFEAFREAGLPEGVLNFVPAAGLDFGRMITGQAWLGGVNFVGSLRTFQWLWSEIGLNVQRYRAFPRLSGECGGKNFHLIHPSAHLETAVAQTIRSAFEYSGQKCSACSRLYAPASLWPEIRDQLADIGANRLKLGPATEPDTYLSAVIDGAAFDRIGSYLEFARQCGPREVELLCGGTLDDSQGYYVRPTIFRAHNPRNRLMVDEIFGPVLTCYVYEDDLLSERREQNLFDLINESPYALTGAVFAQDEQFLALARRRLRSAAGNFYLNDKSTGAVVGQQPFGGAKLSGTNDKAGGPHYLMRWCNQQTLKQTHRHLPSYI